MESIQVQCVIVVYQVAMARSKTICSLIDCCRGQNGLADQLSVLIYDNSILPQPFNPADFPFATVQYHHDPQNGGLAAAYNYALQTAQSRNIEWLLLLDQDTALDTFFFQALLAQIKGSLPLYVSALVPKLIQNGKLLSPQIIGKFRNVAIEPRFSGLCPSPVTALNSAACVRVNAVDQAGGFPCEYWLDYLDHIMMHRLQMVGGRVVVLDATVEHRLSLLNLESEMSIERYSNMLAAEWRFIRETRSRGGPLLHRLRLLKRSLVLFLFGGNKAYARKALRESFTFRPRFSPTKGMRDLSPPNIRASVSGKAPDDILPPARSTSYPH